MSGVGPHRHTERMLSCAGILKCSPLPVAEVISYSYDALHARACIVDVYEHDQCHAEYGGSITVNQDDDNG